MSDIEKRMQASRESKGHGLRRTYAQQGVDVDPDADLDEFSVEDDPDTEPEATPWQKKLVTKAVTGERPLFQGGTRTDTPVQTEQLVEEIKTTGLWSTGEDDTGGFDTGMIDTGYLEDEPPKITGTQREDDTGGSDTGEPAPLTINAQGVQVTDAVLEDFNESVLDDSDTLIDLAKDYQKNHVYNRIDEADQGDAARADFMQNRRELDTVWSGDGPGGEGELVFFDGDPVRGYLVLPDGEGGKTYTNITGFFSPPRDT